MKKEYSNTIILGLQFLLAALFLFFGIRKLIGDDAAVQTFSEIGAGQWLRQLVGTLEISGAIGLLIPRLSELAAIGLASVMTGAVATEVFLIADGNPVTPLILLVMTATVAWHRRHRTIALLEAGRGVTPRRRRSGTA
jgi:putative oxidoreductase